MKSRWSALGIVGLATVACADPPAPTAPTPIPKPSIVITTVESAPCPSVVPRRTRYWSWSFQPARPIWVIDANRYEPGIRDIRSVPRSRSLPGWDTGLGEVLPVIPPAERGYFIIPTTR